LLIQVEDIGPAPSQVSDVLNKLNYTENVSGGLQNTFDMNDMSEENVKLSQAIEDSNQKNIFVWPHVSKTPVNEYDSTSSLFTKAFPWLFPSEAGDITHPQTETLNVSDWAYRLLHYYDGRFAKDKMWCFFVMNFLERKKSVIWFILCQQMV
jgi:hypothetical protein